MSLIGKSVGNYQIRAKLGEGGMGAVYLGEHPLIGKRVAVKVLLDELAAKEDIVQRFFHEAKAVNDIGHANIVDVLDFGKLKSDSGADIVYFIMEFLDGESLADRLRHGPVGPDEAVHVIEQCCSALAASHHKGIVHRDLKPDNIYLIDRGGDGQFVKLLDFGIAKLSEAPAGASKTRTGLVIGTPAYMSPEQCEGKGQIDARSDVYSLGIVLYELLAGRVPFPGEGFGEVLVAHLTQAPEPPSLLNPRISPALESVVMHAIEKDRERRFQSMAELQTALRRPDLHLANWQSGRTRPGRGAARSATTAGRSGSGSARAPQLGSQGGLTPTTLSGAASESLAGVIPARRSVAPLVTAVGAAAALGLGALLFAGRSSSSVAGAPLEHAGSETESYTVEIASDPPGATVIRGDTSERGTTPWRIRVKRGSEPFDVRIEREGYAPQKRAVNTDRDYKIEVALLRAPPPAPPVAAAPAPPSSLGGGSINARNGGFDATAAPAVAGGRRSKRTHLGVGRQAGHLVADPSVSRPAAVDTPPPADDDGKDRQILDPRI